MPRHDRKRWWENKPVVNAEPRWWGVVREVSYKHIKNINPHTWDFEVEEVYTYHARPYHLYLTHYIAQKMSKEEAEALCVILNAGCL